MTPAISANGNEYRLFDVVPPGFVECPLRPSPDYDWDGTRWTLNFDKIKSRALIAIDKAAGSTALRYITDRPGQSMTYLKKADEAQAHRDQAYPSDLTNYPLIASELTAIRVTNATATAQMATDSILATQQLWVTKAAQIELARRVGKEKVKAATTPAAVSAAYTEAVSTLAEL